MNYLIILLVVSASVVLVKSSWDCPCSKVVSPFYLEDFDGRWYQLGFYMTDSKLGYAIGVLGDCVTSDYKYNETEGVTHIRTHQTNKYGVEQTTDDGTGKYENPDQLNGRITVKEMIEGVQMEMVMSIVAFDKDKYAVVHLCKKLLGSLIFEAVWFLTREPTPSTETWEYIYKAQQEIAEQGGPAVDKYIYQSWDKCPEYDD